jgi:hypothetical protein
MKAPDVDKMRGEKKRSLKEFLMLYNEGLPAQFPRASLPLLEEYRKSYPSQFKSDSLWSLELHRKKFMDWLPQYLKALSRVP